MSNYPADPGRVFASDVHRRVMANAPNPGDDPLNVEELVEQRIAKDDHLDISTEELVEVLKDLEADGHVERSGDGWSNTNAGFAALTGPVGDH